MVEFFLWMAYDAAFFFFLSDKMVAYYLPSIPNYVASWISYGHHGKLKWYKNIQHNIQLKYKPIIGFVRSSKTLTQINLTLRISQNRRKVCGI